MEQLTIEQIIDNTTTRMTSAIDNLKNRLKKLRTTVANPLEISDIPVEYYGQKTPLSHVSNISVPESNQFLIKPYDPNSIKDIIHALNKFNNKYNPVEDNKSIRIIFAPLTNDARKQIVKELKDICEHERVAIRNIRRDEISDIKSLEHINDDDAHLLKNKIQEVTDHYINIIHELYLQKEKSILSI